MIETTTVISIRNGVSSWLNGEGVRVQAIGQRMDQLRLAFTQMTDEQFTAYIAPNDAPTAASIKAGLVKYIDDQIALETNQATAANDKFSAIIARQEWVIGLIDKATDAPDENAAAAILAGVRAQMDGIIQAQKETSMVNQSSIGYLTMLRAIVDGTPEINFNAWLG